MRQLLFLVALIFVFVTGCKKDNGPAGLNSLINIVPRAPGTDCAGGGITVETGLDVNHNNLLDSTEITDEQAICNGASGTNGHAALIRTSALAANDMCATGGLQIETGADLNDNGILEDSEVQQTQQICNGENGIYDKQIAILLSGLAVSHGTSSTSPSILSGETVKFNIDNFPGVDSAVFVINKVNVSSGGEVLNAKLYNVSDSLDFDNSLVSTGSLDVTSLYSANIFPYLPKKDIELGVDFYMNQNNTFGSFSNAYLVLYRK